MTNEESLVGHMRFALKIYCLKILCIFTLHSRKNVVSFSRPGVRIHRGHCVHRTVRDSSSSILMTSLSNPLLHKLLLGSWSEDGDVRGGRSMACNIKTTNRGNIEGAGLMAATTILRSGGRQSSHRKHYFAPPFVVVVVVVTAAATTITVHRLAVTRQKGMGGGGRLQWQFHDFKVQSEMLVSRNRI